MKPSASSSDATSSVLIGVCYVQIFWICCLIVTTSTVINIRPERQDKFVYLLDAFADHKQATRVLGTSHSFGWPGSLNDILILIGSLLLVAFLDDSMLLLNIDNMLQYLVCLALA